MPVYLDTSALAKWYLDEPGSEAFARWIQDEEDEVWISSLTLVEMRCLLARRRRAQELTPEHEALAFSTFREDVDRAFLFVQPIEDRFLAAALHLIERLADHSLRTLDALHLSVARELPGRESRHCGRGHGESGSFAGDGDELVRNAGIGREVVLELAFHRPAVGPPGSADTRRRRANRRLHIHPP